MLVDSEFIWDVALFYIDSDSDFAHKVQDVIQTWLGCLVQSFCHRNPDTCHLSTRHVAAYSRSVVAIFLTITRSMRGNKTDGLSNQKGKLTYPLLNLIVLLVLFLPKSYVRKDEDDIDSKLIRGLSEIKATSYNICSMPSVRCNDETGASS